MHRIQADVLTFLSPDQQEAKCQVSLFWSCGHFMFIKAYRIQEKYRIRAESRDFKSQEDIIAKLNITTSAWPSRRVQKETSSALKLLCHDLDWKQQLVTQFNTASLMSHCKSTQASFPDLKYSNSIKLDQRIKLIKHKVACKKKKKKREILQ